MDDKSASNSFQRPPLWSAAKASLVAVAGTGSLSVVVMAAGRKEDCSTVVGSVDNGSMLYSPCDLVGFLAGSVCVALMALAVVQVVRSEITRLVVSLMGMVAVLVAAHIGLATLSM